MFAARQLVVLPTRRCGVVFAKKQFSAVTTPSPSPSSSSSGGSSFFQRLNSFLVGTGIGFGSCFYFVHDELKESNNKFENYLDKLESRIKSLESKK